eukprot:CAMPEP_0202415546 /NCGR_PEP_ID=MMETSP1128-20130828/36542_1 /ASSEMBLY_ACC=CAM_ASM_000463 /TAXON_ID=3047 /ORGANISM="Dunaliella tertiolecta, Strain CCMP1320" /LENGTH=153 /DNA_ID=CAMNT_0049022271 /DNA_START=254 /DNA_END=711 /DNA_ORIENTATION=+
MGSTLLDSRPPQMPHKPFPTTSSFRMTSGFDVSASSTNHPLSPAPPGPHAHHHHHHHHQHHHQANGAPLQSLAMPGHPHAVGHQRPADLPTKASFGGAGENMPPVATTAAAAAGGALGAHGRSISSNGFMELATATRIMELPPLKVPRDALRP